MSLLSRLFSPPSSPPAQSAGVEPDTAVPQNSQSMEPAPEPVASVLPSWSEASLARFAAAEPRLGVALEAERRRNMIERATDAWEHILSSGYRANQAVLERPPKAVVVMGWLKRGGAEYVGARLLKEAQSAYGVDDVLLVLTDRDVVETPDWLLPQTRLFVLPRDCHWLSADQQGALLKSYLLAMAPKVIVNCNSQRLWEQWRDDAAAFAVSSRLYGFIFCYEYTSAGNLLGYAASHLHSCIEQLAGVLTDNSWFFEELNKTLGYPAGWRDRFHTLYQPVSEPEPRAGSDPSPGQRPKVLWASRICAQKRPDLLIAVAALCPEFDFHVFGEFYNYGPTHFDETMFAASANVAYRGPFRMLQALPTEDYAAFLYTAAYDGLPNILMAAGAVGLPIVASDVGGIGDLIDDEHGWPIKDADRPEAYAAALRQAVTDRAQAQAKATATLQRIRDRHSDSAYRARIAELGLFPNA